MEAGQNQVLYYKLELCQGINANAHGDWAHRDGCVTGPRVDLDMEFGLIIKDKFIQVKITWWIKDKWTYKGCGSRFTEILFKIETLK